MRVVHTCMLGHVQLLRPHGLYTPPGSSVYGKILATRQEYWSGLSFPSPGALPNPGIKTNSPELQVGSLPLSYRGSPKLGVHRKISLAPGA